MKNILIVIAIIIVGAGLVLLFKSPDSGSNLDYKNTSYTIEGKSVLLKAGISESEAVSGSASKVTTKYFGNEAKGDFNGDGKEDIVFLLTRNSGGSGTFYYVVAALGSNKGYTGTNAILLGDRVAPQTTEFRDGTIIVNYADRKAGQAMTVAPSVGVSRYFKIQANKLVEVAK
jgi:hypothetical protein